MREILSLAIYLLAWLVCKWVIGIQSGLITLIISLGIAVCVYVLIAVKEYKKEKKVKVKNDERPFLNKK